MSRLTDAWRRIAYHDGTGLLTIQRTVLRQMFDEMDARASRAEADADRLAAGLMDFCQCPTYGIENRRARPCDYHALHDEAVAQR